MSNNFDNLIIIIFYILKRFKINRMFIVLFLDYSFYRKIEIIKFATKARQQFIRLLALVKWAAGEDRVDQFQVLEYNMVNGYLSFQEF